jgi:aspartokinase/homoserine dehydrogenase 1
MLIVQKFGGTSVGTAERIAHAASLALESAARGDRVVVVTSAMGGVTNELISAARRAAYGEWDAALLAPLRERHEAAARFVAAGDEAALGDAIADVDRQLSRVETLCTGLSMVRELTPRLLDAVAGTGEMMSAPVLAAAIRAQGGRAEVVEATGLVVTDEQFGAAEPLMEATRERSTERLVPLLDAGVVPVVTGFVGATEEGVTTTLGRGGSDYSATIIGAALEADEVWIWTDVDGVMTANPSDVPEARTLREISYSEATELAYYGAKVLHHKTILPVVASAIPVRIRNSFDPSKPGTRITLEGHPSPSGVKAVTAIHDVSLVTIAGRGMQGIPGIAARAFTAVAAERANVLMISQASSENNICLVVLASEAQRVARALRAALELDIMKGHVDDVTVDDSVAVIAAVGDRMRGTPGIAAKVFGALGDVGVNVIAISQGSSERNISLIVSESDASEAVRVIHRAFDLSLERNSRG